MLPAFEGVFNILPELRICPERPNYDVWTKYEDGYVILEKDGQQFRNRFMRVTKWDKHNLAFLRKVNYMSSREPWKELVREVVTPHLINGYQVVDVVFRDSTIDLTYDGMARDIPALKFREFVEK